MFQELDGLFGRLSESKMKSECVGSAWAKKRKDAATKLVTKRVPGWINFQDGKLVLNEVKAATVRRTFKLSVAGHGVQAIAKQLNNIRNGDILLWHLGIWSRKDALYPKLDPLIVGLKQKGFCFARITEHPDYRMAVAK